MELDIKNFDNLRRQQFIYPSLYNSTRKNQFELKYTELENIDVIIKNPSKGRGSQSHFYAQHFVYLEQLWIWMLDYTAGVDLDELAPRVAEVVNIFSDWFEVNKLLTKRLAIEFGEELDPNAAAPDFYNLLDYEDTLQLLGIALLLRDEISVLRIIECLKFYRGSDGLFEQLIFDYVDDGKDSEQLFHDAPYRLLLQVFFEEDKTKGVEFLQEYLKSWYPYMEGARWWGCLVFCVNAFLKCGHPLFKLNTEPYQRRSPVADWHRPFLTNIL